MIYMDNMEHPIFSWLPTMFGPGKNLPSKMGQSSASTLNYYGVSEE
jgi:hypothetical protein